ncbi:uncharacterized protein LOC118187896, partial [Stegodyphus dumicola]|uniref:uncharacterized protein LOC118187896 n=1 Tax=Stegodyphus dumicola TaxID=202533 RepID=UPI0015AA64FA
MALSSYYVSLNRKDLAERAIVSKREREASRAQRCKEVASYHKELALKSEKYKNLEEGVVTKAPRANEESVVKLKIQEDAKEKLVRRRQKLFRLLDVENKQYM